MDTDANGEERSSPHEINNREAQQGFPCWTMFCGLHERILSAVWQPHTHIAFCLGPRRDPIWPACLPSARTTVLAPEGLPNLAADRSGPLHRIAFLAAKRLRKFLHVRGRGNRAEAAERV